MSFKLSPSDFGFLYKECPRCFYNKVILRIERPRTPMPKIFTKIDLILKSHYHDRRTEEFLPELPSGCVEFSEKWVESQTIEFPGIGACFIRGKFDTVLRFDAGGYGVIDFKTSNHKDNHVRLYSRQLHAYALALENAAPRRLQLNRVEHLGLLCVEPIRMFGLDNVHFYTNNRLTAGFHSFAERRNKSCGANQRQHIAAGSWGGGGSSGQTLLSRRISGILRCPA